jgi:hypothetical protein
LIYKTKQDLQRTIDSAALAAAYKLPNQTVAIQAAYEFTRLHGYDFDPSTNPLMISFPVYDPPRKAVMVNGSTNAKLAFLQIMGFKSMKVSAQGEGESAPLDVYIVLDMSESMTYDTEKPSPWPPAGFPSCQWSSQSDCVARYCNWARKCDPLDIRIKPAAEYFIDQLDSRYDRVGVVVYDQFGRKIIGLTNDFDAVKVAINDLDAFAKQQTSSCPNIGLPSYPPGSCNKQTNIGDGIMVAHSNIASEGRMDAIWSMVLLTDGKANVYRSCSGCPPSCGTCPTLHLCDECQNAEVWAINNAKDTWNRHETVIYTIAYGDLFFDPLHPEYRDLMINIADWTDNGTLDGITDNFWAAPDAAGLRASLAEVAQRIYSRLLR